MGVTRQALYEGLGLLKIVDPLSEWAYTKVQEEAWQQDLDSSPHGHPWHTSFHGSQFPADDPLACGRKQVYTMMNIPNRAAFDRAGATVMSMGKAIEEEYVSTWHKAGVLLSAPPDAPRQTGFKNPRYWLTGSTDAVILPLGWNRPHVVEIKSKDRDVIMAMKRMEKSYDDAHRNQVLTYIWLANQVSPFFWPDYEPVSTGSIFYVARERPHLTHEFFFTLNQEAIDIGTAKLAEWKQAYLDGRLIDRPKEWQWTKGDCCFCEYKNMKLKDGTKVGCREDLRQEITTLADSTAIQFAQELRPGYDYEETRAAVLKRWE